MSEMAYTVRSARGFAETVEALQQEAIDAGWTALAVHDLKERFDKKGIEWPGRLSIVEICNAAFSAQMAAADPRFVLHMPCRAVVRELVDGVEVSILKSTYLAEQFGPGFHEEAAQVESIVERIIDNAVA